ncbi:unnamed protein product [Microthlaspi erraticum]|uniref:Uncharacterized protein n=1 Tax=Microthlaspi erraticum TaxID=1685480 RepID=A0A6D2LP40_9BRAS|nr:unnamed protein product [Microthlaspi erraticum]
MQFNIGELHELRTDLRAISNNRALLMPSHLRSSRRKKSRWLICSNSKEVRSAIYTGRLVAPLHWQLLLLPWSPWLDLSVCRMGVYETVIARRLPAPLRRSSSAGSYRFNAISEWLHGAPDRLKELFA